MDREDSDDKVAPILTHEKLKYFRTVLLQTLLGVSWDDHTLTATILAYVLPPLALLLSATLIKDRTLCLVLGSILPPVVALVVKLFERIVQRYCSNEVAAEGFAWREGLRVCGVSILTGGYSFLAVVHFGELSQRGSWVWFGLSVMSLVTSLATLHWSAVKEFGTQGYAHNEFGWESSSMVRPILGMVILIPEAALFWLMPASVGLSALHIVYALAWLSWTAGIVSSLRATCYFAMEAVNTVVLGDQKKHLLSRTAISLLLNSLVVLVAHTNPLDEAYLNFRVTNSVMIIASFVTSTGLLNWMLEQHPDVGLTPKLGWTEVALELLLVAVKVAVTLVLGYLRPGSQATLIVMAAHLAILALVVLLKELHRARTRMLFLGIDCLSGDALTAVAHWVLRLSLDFAITFLSYDAYSSRLFANQYGNYLALRILTYRSYKRAIGGSSQLSPHLGILLGLALSQQLPLYAIPLLMITLPSSPWLMLVSSCVVPKKNRRRLQWLYGILYALATTVGYSVCLCSGGMLEPLMMFGLPIFLWSVPNYATSTYAARGKQRSIYQNLVKTLPDVARPLQKGTYLIRISKYLTLCRILERPIGSRVVEFRGLESQDVTSCHNIESQTIDNMIEETWGASKAGCSGSFLLTVLRPLESRKHMLFEENEIKLTGIIESEEFAALFRSNFIRVLLLYFKSQGLSKTQLGQLRKIKNNFGFIIPEKEALALYPATFAQKLGPDFELHQSQPKHTVNQPIQHPPKPIEKLPPIKPPAKPQPKPSRQLFEDLQFMVDQTPSHPVRDTKLPSAAEGEQSSNAVLVQPKKPQPKALSKLLESDHQDSSSLLVSELTRPCYAELAISFAVYCIGRNKYIDQKRLFELMKDLASAERTLKNMEYEHKGSIAMLALRAALKLSIDAMVAGQQEPLSADEIVEEMAKCYVGVMEEKEFEQAIAEKKQHIWVLHFKEQLIVSRYTDRQVDLYLFEVEESIAEAVWNNMRFELYYATNDDDERYSIQTHPSFLRNMLVEACSEPLGYAPYYSGVISV